jgi:hypothetical protein
MAAAKRGGKPAKPRKQTLKPARAGQKPISFKPGGLHESVGVPQGQKIPAATVAAAAAGKFGPKARKQAQFAKNVLTGPKTSSAGKKGKGRSGR